jgi:hypothetical protein
VYSAYLDQNWNDNAFGDLLPPVLGGSDTTPAPHLPAGFNTIQNTISRSTSSLYGDPMSSENYLIGGVLNVDSEVKPIIDRWMAWVDGDPCANLDQLEWPEKHYAVI